MKPHLSKYTYLTYKNTRYDPHPYLHTYNNYHMQRNIFQITSQVQKDSSPSAYHNGSTSVPWRRPYLQLHITQLPITISDPSSSPKSAISIATGSQVILLL